MDSAPSAESLCPTLMYLLVNADSPLTTTIRRVKFAVSRASTATDAASASGLTLRCYGVSLIMSSIHRPDGTSA